MNKDEELREKIIESMCKTIRDDYLDPSKSDEDMIEKLNLYFIMRSLYDKQIKFFIDIAITNATLDCQIAQAILKIFQV